eukprot:GHVU01056443.1.p1 GENE.GHVU01056443.1~~GHVU01056443.1.p1  ORF type:complete len:190 (+),score=9.08 GHVU01056443.1:92-661(+)
MRNPSHMSQPNYPPDGRIEHGRQNSVAVAPSGIAATSMRHFLYDAIVKLSRKSAAWSLWNASCSSVDNLGWHLAHININQADDLQRYMRTFGALCSWRSLLRELDRLRQAIEPSYRPFPDVNEPNHERRVSLWQHGCSSAAGSTERGSSSSSGDDDDTPRQGRRASRSRSRRKRSRRTGGGGRVASHPQ